jgi:hypothetical protein
MLKLTATLLTAAFGLLLLGGCSTNPIAGQAPTGSPSHADGSGGGGSGGGGGGGGGGY